MSLPEGFGYVPGRSRDTAIKLLDSAAEVNADPATAVRTVRDGYHVQDDVLEHYNSLLADEDEVIAADADAEVAAAKAAQEQADADAAKVAADKQAEDDEAAAKAAAKAEEDAKAEEANKSTESTKTEEPNKNASTADWLEYSKSLPNWDEKDAELSRSELVEKYSVPTEPAK